MSNSDEVKRLEDSAEECRALSDAVKDEQARRGYEQMAEAYVILTDSREERGAFSSSKRRRRFKQVTSLKDRLEAFAKDARSKASLLQHGAEKDDLLKRARRADTASHLDDWVNSPGLQSPK